MLRIGLTFLSVFGLVLPQGLIVNADETKLLAHWPLIQDSRDAGPARLETINYGVTFSPAGDSGNASTFDGRGGHLAVAAEQAPKLGESDFSIALWLNADAAGSDDPGDLVSQFNPESRTGFCLSLRTNSGVTSCQANTRQLQFGIDAGTEPNWGDEGKPGAALFAFALATHGGSLYAGTCEPAKDSAGHVYRYAGPGEWTDLGAPDRANAISAIASYRGQLYVASSKYRLAGSALPESENPHRGGRVYRLEAGDEWRLVGELPSDVEAIAGLVVFQDRLYVSSLYRPAGFFRYEKDGRWTSLPTPDSLRVEALCAFNGALYASSYDGGYVFRFDGERWQSLGQVGDNTQTYSFTPHLGRLHVGTWPSGRVYRLDESDRWQDAGQLGQEKEVMGMLVYNGKLYGGTLPLAEAYRHDGATSWARVGRIDHTPDVTYRRAWTMATYAGRLFVSALPSGHVHSMQAGACVTLDRELPTGWRHVAAIRDGRSLKLYVDGQLAANSEEFDPRQFSLDAAAALFVGRGPADFWQGQLRDARIYGRALSPGEIETLARAKP